MNQQQPKEISKQQLQEQYIEHVKQIHAEWLRSAGTQQFLSALNRFRTNHVNRCSANVNNLNVSDASFRQMMINVQNCDAVLAFATDVELLLKILNPTEPTKE